MNAKTMFFDLFIGIAMIAVLSVPTRAVADEPVRNAPSGIVGPPRFDARDALRDDLAVNRAAAGQTIVNGTVNAVTVDPAARGVYSQRLAAQPTRPLTPARGVAWTPPRIVPTDAPPVREVVSVTRIQLPTFVLLDPANPARVEVGVVRQGPEPLTPDSRPALVIGGVTLPPLSRPRFVSVTVDAPALQFRQGPIPESR